MGAANSSSDAPPFLMPLPSEVLEHLFSFLSMSDLLMAACVCNDWKREAFRMFRSQSNKVLLDQSTMVRAGELVKIKTCIGLIIALGEQQNTSNLNVVICGLWLENLCHEKNLITRWVERRRLALALSTLQRLEVGDLTASMAKAFFSALANFKRVQLKMLYLPQGWTGSVRSDQIGRALLKVEVLKIGALERSNTATLLKAICESVGQLRSLSLGCQVLFPVDTEVGSLAEALNKVEELSLDLRARTGFRDHLLLKATLARLASPGGSKLRHLTLKNLDNYLTRHVDPSLWLTAISVLDLFSLHVNLFTLNQEEWRDDSFGTEVQDIVQILNTLPGEKSDKMVRTEFGEERHYHFRPTSSS